MIKYTQVFEQSSTSFDGGSGRNAGWSETLYYDGNTITSAFNQAGFDLDKARAKLLVANAAIVGERAAIIDPKAGTRTWDIRYKGNPSWANDVPQMAAHVTLRAALPAMNRRETILRGIPDVLVENGEYRPDADFEKALKAYVDILASGWKFRVFDRANATKQAIDSITADGIVDLGAPRLFGANDTYLNMRGARDEYGHRFSGRFTWKPHADITKLKLMGWTQGPVTFTKGELIADKWAYVGIQTLEMLELTPRIIVRKVGRPSSGYRGRRTAQH